MKQSKKPNATPQGKPAKKKLKLKAAPKTENAKREKKMSKKKIINSIMIVFLSMVFIGGVCVFFMIANIMKDAPSLTASAFNSQDSSSVLASNGESLFEVGAENRQSITYDQLPQTTIDAFLAIEDSRYFTHNGFDLPRFVSSAINNLRSGDLSQGGSTLTMQMIDNARKGSPDYDETNASSWQKIEWKVQEIFLSMQAESNMSKEEILVKYLNKVNFGYTARGIQKGAEYYFGKDVSQLNLSESAFLAGVVNAPNLFNPYKGTQWSDISKQWINFYDYAIDRRNDTLYQMLNHGYITEEEYKLARSTELAFQLQGERFFHSDSNDVLLDLVRTEAMKKYDVDIYSEGVIVHTSIDVDAQNVADGIISANAVPLPGGGSVELPTKENYDVGSTVLNAQTGEIVAVVGGRNFNLDDSTTKNQVTERHQTGSTIKPVLDYGPGFDQLGYATSHTFTDVPLDIYGTGRALANSNGMYKGDVEFVEAVGQSYNTTAAQSLKDVMDVWGEDNIKDYMTKLGFDKDVIENFNLQYSIGGSDMTSSTKTLASAYAIFANNGQHIDPHIITKIEFPDDPDKETIVVEPEGIQTISAQAAYLMSDILNKATSNNFFMSKIWPGAGYTVYGKTGTSDWGDSGVEYGIPVGSIRDEWMVNYTSKYVVATWEGHNGFDYISQDLLYQNIPGHINRALLDSLAAKEDMGVIENPGGISTISHVKGKYPYAAPTENIPSEMVATGMIISDKAKLESLSADDLKSLDSFSASMKDDSSDTIKLSFGAYPDADKTKDPSHSKSYSVLGINFTGNVFYDPGFVFGKVVYKADVKLNGNVVQTITTSDTESEHTLSGVNPGDSIQVCGYYAYSIDSKKSNEMCSDVSIPQPKVEVNKDTLKGLITQATTVDITKVQPEFAANLTNAINSANAIVNKEDATQEEVDAQVSALQTAINDCAAHPIESSGTNTNPSPNPTPNPNPNPNQNKEENKAPQPPQ